MVSFKIVIGIKSGKCVQKEVAEPEARMFLGKKIGAAVKGDDFGFPGYEFSITGGSDSCGFPMRKDVEGFGRKRVLEVKGTGVKKIAKGIRRRRTVCGNTIHPKISQINLKIMKEGATPLIAEEKVEKKEAKPEKKEEPKKEEKPTPEKKPEAKPEPKPEPKPEKKEEPKKEEKPKPVEKPKPEAKPAEEKK